MEQKKRIAIEKDLIFTYDPESDEFQRAYEGYKAIIDSTASIDDMLENVGYMVAKYGQDQYIEGVGRISVNQKCSEPDDWCGIDVEHEFDLNGMVDYEVSSWDC